MGLSVSAACALTHDGYLTSPRDTKLPANHCPHVRPCRRDPGCQTTLGADVEPGIRSREPRETGYKTAPLHATVVAAPREHARGPGAQQGPAPRTVRPPGAIRPRLGPVLKVPLGKEPPMHGIPRKGAGHAPWEAPRVEKNPSGPSRPPYLTGAASSGRHHGAAGPVRLLRRRHLPAPGPRPRRQPRPVLDGSSTIARDFTLSPPTYRPPYRARAPQPRLSGAWFPATKEPLRPPSFPLLLARCLLRTPKTSSADICATHRLHPFRPLQ